ncbi:MAG: 1-acyl-sn-glycerol-3-phosphate acyltransferase [Paraglaciecola sp.]|jgi:1-acyl-sn-glycerol-3-phosphate acyltransferase
MGQPLNTPILCEDIPRVGNKLSYFLGKSVLWLMGWRFSGVFPSHSKMILIVAPHTSNWDFVIGLAVAFSLRLKITFFGKHSIFIPPFNRLLRHWGGIPVERSASHGVVGQIAAEMRKADKMILCLAPEGTRSKVENWKTGFLHIAYQAEVPVFLVAFDYKKKHIEFGPVLKIGEDIPHELDKIYQHYAGVVAKYPDKARTNVRPHTGEHD